MKTNISLMRTIQNWIFEFDQWFRWLFVRTTKYIQTHFVNSVNYYIFLTANREGGSAYGIPWNE